MSEIGYIPNPQSVTIPAQAEKVFDKQFCKNISISATPEGVWTACFDGYPYDGETLLDQGSVIVNLEDIKALAAQDPELAQVMGTVLAVVGKYLVKCRVAGQHTVTVANIAEILV